MYAKTVKIRYICSSGRSNSATKGRVKLVPDARSEIRNNENNESSMTVVTKPRDDTRENRVFSNEYLLGLDAASAAVRASGEVMLIAAVLAEAKMAAREKDDATRLNATNDAGLMLSLVYGVLTQSPVLKG